MLPITESLARIHSTGIIHRDISPDNIMLLQGGSLKLMDFGAARKYRDVAGGQFTVIAKDAYAPAEQYDRNSEQGPFTDVYALCATMYFCITGKAPDGSVQRMFLDELKSPSELGINIDPSYEKLIMKGLSMQPEKRFRDMESLSAQIRAALPKEPDPASSRKRFMKFFIPSAAAGAAAIIAFSAWHQYDITHKFRNVVTESFVMGRPEDMSDEEFQKVQENVEQELISFAGEDNYEITSDDGSIRVLLPLSCFGESEIGDVISERFLPILGFDPDDEYVPEVPGDYEYEIHAVWEDADSSVLAGENQCGVDEVKGITVTQVYSAKNDALMTKGEWSNVVTDMKVRLDALDTPYAFGTLYGNDRKIVVKLEASRTGGAVNSTLGINSGFKIRGEWPEIQYDSEISADDMRPEVKEDDSGKLVLEAVPEAYPALEEITKVMQQKIDNGEERLYMYRDGRYFGSSPISDAALESGVLEFDTFYLGDSTQIEADRRYFLDYLCCVINETSMPVSYELETRFFEDEKREPLFEFSGQDVYSLNFSSPHMIEDTRELIASMEAEGLQITYNGDDKIFIFLDHAQDEKMVPECMAKIEDICKRYDLLNKWGNFYFILCDEETTEQGTNRARVVISTDYSAYGSRKAHFYLWGDEMQQFQGGAAELWNAADLGGFEKYEFNSVGD